MEDKTTLPGGNTAAAKYYRPSEATSSNVQWVFIA